MTPSLSSINLLEWLTELGETFCLLDHQLIIKGHNSGTDRWERCTGQGMGKEVGFPCPLGVLLSTHLHRVGCQPRSSSSLVIQIFKVLNLGPSSCLLPFPLGRGGWVRLKVSTLYSHPPSGDQPHPEGIKGTTLSPLISIRSKGAPHKKKTLLSFRQSQGFEELCVTN